MRAVAQPLVGLAELEVGFGQRRIGLDGVAVLDDRFPILALFRVLVRGVERGLRALRARRQPQQAGEDRSPSDGRSHEVISGGRNVRP